MRRLLAAVAVVLVLLLAWSATPYVHAVRLLHALQSGNTDRSIGTRDLMLGDLRARAYVPYGRDDAPVLVLVHGVHHLGIEEPRLQAFARALAHEGVLVVTPEIPGAADYQVAPSDIRAIGESALLSQHASGSKKVGLMGLSFSGGLSLIAASRAPYSDAIAYVIAVGAHDSMQRVATFYGTSRMLRPDGSTTPFAAHEYGQLVMVYDHPEDFFAPDQVNNVRSVLKAYLYEDGAALRSALENCSGSSCPTLHAWAEHHRDGLGALIVADAERRKKEMDSVSPHGQIAALHAPVLLLHGAGDNVIPPSETEFLARDIPRPWLADELISPAVSHVELKAPGFWDKLRLLLWMGRMFREVETRNTYGSTHLH
jgi:dienelactone hydrolase